MKYSRATYAAFAVAIEEAASAQACIAENRGPEKDEAREAYECAVSESLVPALTAAIDIAAGDLDARDIERIANTVLKALVRKGLIGEEA